MTLTGFNICDALESLKLLGIRFSINGGPAFVVVEDKFDLSTILTIASTIHRYRSLQILLLKDLNLNGQQYMTIQTEGLDN